MFFNGGPIEFARIRPGRSGRVSSWDHRGRNQDYWVIGAGETRVLADLEGPGVITHIWMTQWCRRTIGVSLIDPVEAEESAPVFEVANALGLGWEEPDPDYYRKVLIRITWDDQENPAVLVPLGDFFGIGHSMPNSYNSAFFTVTAKPEESLRFGGSASVNSWVPMPFARRALVEIINENDVAYGQYFHIDFELQSKPLPDDVGYFHASWRRENPCDGWAPDLQVNTAATNIPNLDGSGNFVVLETEGRGQYVGCNLSVYHHQNTWWGEGDDMIFVDDDVWPPSIHGTGTEDYFNHAWGMQRRSSLFHGAIVHESDVPGYSVNYRFHVVDPVHFQSRIRVTIEHGHANHLADDWSATAYWYQQLPSPISAIVSMAERLPTRSEIAAPLTPKQGSASAEQIRALQARRWRAFSEQRELRSRREIERTRRWADENTAAVRRLRERLLRDDE